MSLPEERLIAGLRCMEVLAHLGDYVDGDLQAEEVKKVEAHVQGCDWCAQFGGAFSDVVKGIRARLAKPEPLDASVEERLVQRLGLSKS